MTEHGVPADQIDTSQPHPARVYDFYLGGKDNYPVDWELAEQVLAIFPTMKSGAQVNRAFMHRATRWLADQAGIRQFLDIGTGIPTQPNLHQVAQAVAPDARIVYTDNDPIVLAHAQALLRSTPEGRTAYIQADVRDPRKIFAAPQLRDTLDLSRPVALSMNALLHFVPDEFGPYDLVRQLVAELPSGSYLVLSHVTTDFDADTWGKIVAFYRNSGIPAQARSLKEILPFFDGLELVDPGVVVATDWRPEPGQPGYDAAPGEPIPLYVAVARKP